MGKFVQDDGMRPNVPALQPTGFWGRCGAILGRPSQALD